MCESCGSLLQVVDHHELHENDQPLTEDHPDFKHPHEQPGEWHLEDTTAYHTALFTSTPATHLPCSPHVGTSYPGVHYDVPTAEEKHIDEELKKLDAEHKALEDKKKALHDGK